MESSDKSCSRYINGINDLFPDGTEGWWYLPVIQLINCLRSPHQSYPKLLRPGFAFETTPLLPVCFYLLLNTPSHMTGPGLH